MTDKIDLGNGGWAKLRTPEEVPERKRRPLAKVQRLLIGSNIGEALVNRAEQGEEVTEDEVNALLRPHLADDAMDLFDQSDDLLMYALLEEWSYDKPITVDEIQDLPGAAYDKLRDECRPLLNAVLGNTEDNEAEILDPRSKGTPGSD